MSLSDCSKCWDTPCNCGYSFKDYSKEQLAEYIVSITQYREKRVAKDILYRAINLLNNPSPDKVIWKDLVEKI